MMRTAKITAVIAVLVFAAACHKKTPAPPAVPLPAPAPEQTAPPAPPAATVAPKAPRHQPVQTPAAPAAPPQAPDFRLGQSVTAVEIRENNVEMERHLRHAGEMLVRIEHRSLTRDQKRTLAQIRGFMTQARQMRATDIAAARSLAQRADALATDLVSRLK